jgi:hypothetical protein
MTRFVGLDVSHKITAICIVDNAVRSLWRGQCPTVPKQTNVLVRRHAGVDARIGIETGDMTSGLVNELRVCTAGAYLTCFTARSKAKSRHKRNYATRHLKVPAMLNTLVSRLVVIRAAAVSARTSSAPRGRWKVNSLCPDTRFRV